MRTLLHILLCALCLSSCVRNEAYFGEDGSGDPLRYVYDQGQILLRIDNSLSQLEVDSLLQSVGITREELNTIQHADVKTPTSNGWELTAYDTELISFKKPLSDFGTGGGDLMKIWMGHKVQVMDYSILNVAYGRNGFKSKEDVGSLKTIPFTLRGSEMAKNVYLSGTFNNWSTLSHPMEFRNDGWYTDLALEPGKHMYKFIVDGHWILDPLNLKSEGDGMGNTNSVLFVYDHVFKLPEFQAAEQVFVAGSFNDWREDELRMLRTSDGWELPIYLRVGTHAYKFRVDGQWVLDPNNSLVRPDGKGNKNSFMAIGDTMIFTLNNHLDAKEVFLVGDFNAWQEGELQMTRTENGWELPYVLRPGNYAYKYLIDRQWSLDDNSSSYIGTGEEKNSVLFVDPNTLFTLADEVDAKRVYLSGTFNNWSETGYVMRKKEGVWTLDIHLDPGKHQYKFLVDGQWIHDPRNALWEWNEHHTKNSIIWKE